VRLAGSALPLPERWSSGGGIDVTEGTMSATGQNLHGTYSTGTIALTGAIDAADTAKAASLTLDAGRSWTVPADSHLICLSDSAGISGTTIAKSPATGTPSTTTVPPVPPSVARPTP
jgi:hypothetical protein